MVNYNNTNIAMASQKIPHIFPIEYNVCTKKLLVAVDEQSDLYMVVTTKAFLVATTR